MRVTTVIETEDCDKMEICLNDSNQIILDINKINYKLEINEVEELCNTLSMLLNKMNCNIIVSNSNPKSPQVNVRSLNAFDEEQFHRSLEGIMTY